MRLVEGNDVAASDPTDPLLTAFRVAAVRVVLWKDESTELAHRAELRVIRLDAEVVPKLASDPIDLPQWERGRGKTIHQDPNRLPGRLAGASSMEAEELFAVVEFQGRPDPLEAVRELRRRETAGAAQEQPRRELRDAVGIALRDHARGNAPAERDEGIRRQGERHEDGAVPQHGPVGEVQVVASCAWNRTTDRRSRIR